MTILKDGSSVVLNVTRDDLNNIVPTLALLEEQLKDECAQIVIVNLETLESIFSLQIGTLAAMHVMCYENVAVMKLSNVHVHVKSQLTMVGLDKLMAIHHGSNVVKESFNP